MEFKILLLFSFIYLIQARHAKDNQDLELELVQVLFRHGERTPLINEYYTYPYNDVAKYKPYGLGQLTNKGKEQMYNVGRMLRERYDDFLFKRYFSNDVYAYTSEDDRTSMSLQLVLAGLYPPDLGFLWNADLKWLPLPFRYTPKELDILMKPYDSSRFIELKKQIFKTPESIHEISKYSHVLNLVSKVIERAVNPEDPGYPLMPVYNLLHINERMGLPLPTWCTKKVMEDMKKCLAVIQKFTSFTAEQKRINGGTMIRTFLENMNLNNTFNNPRKIYLYSGHDYSLNGFLHAHNIDSIEYPDFGTTVMFEKFRDSENTVYVRLLVYDSTNKKLIPLKIGECEEFCSIDDYLTYVHDAIPSDSELMTLWNDFNFDKLKDLFFADKAVKIRRS